MLDRSSEMREEQAQEPRTLNLCFQSLVKGYQERSAQRINRRFTELVDRSYSMPCDKWRAAFSFGQYVSMDNMAPIYLNMLETIKEWMVART